MPDKPIRFGIIGCGNAGRMQARAAKEMPELEVAAICDTDIGRVKTFGEEFGIAEGNRYGSLDKFLSRDDMDYVVVSVPSGLHAEVGVEVAKAGHNVTVEKPIEVTLNAADKLIADCCIQDVNLHIISQNRFQPDVQTARKLVAKLGDLVGTEITMDWYRNQGYYSSVNWRGTWKLDGGGALINQCIHMVDGMRYLVGDVRYVQADAGLLGHTEIQTEDILYAIGRFKNGARFSIKATTCDRGIGESGKEVDTNQLRIYGTKGLLALDQYHLNSESAIEDDQGILRPVQSAGIKTVERASDPLSQGGHAQQLYRIGRAIRGEQIEVVTPGDARATLELIMAIYSSIEQDGKRVTLPICKDYVPNPEIMRQRLTR